MSGAGQAYCSFRRRAENYDQKSVITIPENMRNILLKQMLQTNPTSTTLLWQKQAALKSTTSWVGATKCFLLIWSGKNAIMRYWRNPWGCRSCMYIPFVVSEACCRKTVSPASFNMSIGIRNRWAANVVFMIGMYWCARSPDTEMTRIRL